MSVTFFIAGYREKLAREKFTYEAKYLADQNEMNVSNTNAAYILDFLGIDYESDYGIYGEISGFILEKKCKIALEKLKNNPSLDASIPSKVEVTPGKATVIHGGLPEDYLLDRITRLRDIACVAGQLGRVCWG